MDLYSLTLAEVAKKIKAKEVSIKEVLDDIYSRIDTVEPKVEAFITLTKEKAYERAQNLQQKLDNGEDIGPLGGVPIAIKDNISTEGVLTTCASKMLENYTPIYNATVINKLEEAGAIVIGKTNMDEFAMGSSTETSKQNETKNPWDLDRVPGGSSGGSAAAVSAQMAYASLGSDTGGSIRQPASYCSVVGLKPTYGLISRFGLIAFASSLDQIGPFARTVEDAALMLNAIAGHDEKDTTSANLEEKDYTKALVNDIKGKVVGIPTDFIREGISPDVKEAYDKAIETLKGLGAEIKEISLEYAKYSLATYYIIATAEASSNLGRYGKAFEDCDVIMIPTAPKVAFKFGAHDASPLEMYLEDIYTVPVNIAGLPGISIPGGFGENDMPIGIQFIANAFDEMNLLQVAYTFEQNTPYHNEVPTMRGGNN